ncbi:MAG: helix-turn-helix domain-containing protein [Methylocystis sp.]
MPASEQASGARSGASRGGVTAVEKLEWIEALTLVRDLRSSAPVGILLATKFINNESGEAWPSCATMARILDLDKKTVNRAVGKLVATGYLDRQSGVKGRRSNTYRLRFLAKPESRDKSVPETGTFLSKRQGQECPTNPMKEPIERTHPLSPKGEIDGGSLAFEAFEKAWQWDDPADAREPARRAFNKLNQDERAEAIRHAPAYLADCARKNRKRCFAKGYLEGKRWAGYASAPACAANGAAQVHIYPGTPQWRAWEKHKRRKLPQVEIRGPDGRPRMGWYAPSEWPPGHSHDGAAHPAPGGGQKV